jgi:site-specific recombinase
MQLASGIGFYNFFMSENSNALFRLILLERFLAGGKMLSVLAAFESSNFHDIAENIIRGKLIKLKQVLLHFVDDLRGDIDVCGFSGNEQLITAGSQANAEIIPNQPEVTVCLPE